MLDINLFRNDADAEKIRQSQRRRYADVKVVDEVIELDKEHRRIKSELDVLNKELFKGKNEIRRLRKSGEDHTEALKKQYDVQAMKKAKEEEDHNVVADLDAKLRTIGNLVHHSVPTGDDEKDNQIVRTWPENFKPTSNHHLKNHVDLVRLLGFADLKRGSSVAGGRGYYLTEFGELLNQALICFGLFFMAKKGHKPVRTPFMMNKDVMEKCAQLAQFDEELYKVTGGEVEKYLIATSEQPLCAYHKGEWISPSSFH